MCLENKSSCFFKEYLENVVYRMLSEKSTGRCPISEPLFKGAAVFSKPGTVRVVFTRTFLLTLSLWLESSRILGTGFEFLQLLWTPSLCLPAGLGRRVACWPVVYQRGPSFLPVHQVSCTFLLVQDLDATGEQCAVVTSVGSVLVAKAWRHKGLKPASRKFPEQKQVPSTLSWSDLDQCWGSDWSHTSLF